MIEKQSKALEQFLRRVKSEIRSKEAKSFVEHELQVHIFERKNELVDQGYTEEEAETIAIKQMGNPISLGKEMHKIHKPKIEDWFVEGLGLIASILFFFTTIYLLYQYGYALDEGIYVAAFISNGLWILLLGCMICFIIFYNTSKIKNKKISILVSSLTLVILIVYGLTITVGWFISYSKAENNHIQYSKAESNLIQSENITFITFEELQEVLDSEGIYTTYIGGKRCPLCTYIMPDFQEFIESFNLDVFYYNTTQDQHNRPKEMREFLYSINLHSGPITIISDNREIVKVFEGENMVAEMKEYFE